MMALPKPVVAETVKVPSWKRTLDILIPSQEQGDEQSRKRQKTNGSGGSPADDAAADNASSAIAASNNITKVLGQLEAGLAIVPHLEGASEETKKHASELRRLLYQDASLLLRKSVKDAGLDAPLPQKNSEHTAVPAPIPGVKVSSSSGSNSPNPGTATDFILPPLPPITDLTLLNAPFTHSASLPQHIAPTSTNCYESLEFLGDAYIEVFATKIIHKRFSMYNVGQKAGLRELLVRNETLSQYSRDYGMAHRITMPRNSKESLSGPKWTKILADMFEAYVACIILSDEMHGAKIAENWMSELWEPLIKDWQEKGEGRKTGVQEHMSHDIKGELQRYVVSKGVRLDYNELKPVDFDKSTNRTTYFMGVYLTGWGYNRVKLGSGEGRSKQLAGSEAARNAFAISKAVLDDAHKKKLKFDAGNLKKKQGFV